MSKYMIFDSDAFASRDLLVDALGSFGFAKITEGKDLPLEGWDKQDARTADIVIRRNEAGDRQLLGDVGFQRTTRGYVPIIDDLDLSYSLGKDFIRRLQTEYHQAAAVKMARSLSGKLHREQVGKTIKIRVRF